MNEVDQVKQEQIAVLLAAGVSSRRIARALGCSKCTVLRYRRLFTFGYDIEMETRHQLADDELAVRGRARGRALMAAISQRRRQAEDTEQSAEQVRQDELAELIDAQARDDRRWQIQYGPSLDRPLPSGQSWHDLVAAE